METLKLYDLEINMGFDMEDIQKKFTSFFVATKLFGFDKVETFSDPGYTTHIEDFGTVKFGPFKRIELNNGIKRYNFIFFLHDDMIFKEAAFSGRYFYPDEGPIKSGKTRQEVEDILDIMIEFMS